MNKRAILLLILTAALVSACGTEEKTEQMIIPQAQLDALEKAKQLQNDMQEMMQEREKEIQQQIN